MAERIYTEEDVAAILARAAKRQRPASRATSPGLTLAEIEEAGWEAGLSPEAIRAAAAELDLAARSPARPEIAVTERWVDARVEEGMWEDVVASLRHQFGTSSAWWAKDTSALGAAQEWTHSAMSGVRTTVTLSPRDERTLLRVMQEDAGIADERIMGVLTAAFLALLPSVLAGALVAETLGWGDLAGIATIVLVFLSGVAIGSPLFAGRVRRNRERQAARVEGLADDLAQQLGAAATGRPPELGAEPRLDLSDLEDVAAPSPQADAMPGRRSRA